MSGFPYPEDLALDRAAMSLIAGPLTNLGLTEKDYAVYGTRNVENATGHIFDRRIVLHLHPDAPIPDFVLPTEWDGFPIERREWPADELGG